MILVPPCLKYPEFQHLRRLEIKVSEADPFRVSCTLVILRNYSSMCLVPLKLLKFLHYWGNRCGSLSLFQDRSPLTREKLNATIRSLLTLCNVSGYFAGHSLRIATATTAAHVGISVCWIKP